MIEKKTPRQVQVVFALNGKKALIIHNGIYISLHMIGTTNERMGEGYECFYLDRVGVGGKKRGIAIAVLAEPGRGEAVLVDQVVNAL